MYQTLDQIIVCDRKNLLPTKPYGVSSPLKCICHTQYIINTIPTLHPFNLFSKNTIYIHYIYYEHYSLETIQLNPYTKEKNRRLRAAKYVIVYETLTKNDVRYIWIHHESMCIDVENQSKQQYFICKS